MRWNKKHFLHFMLNIDSFFNLWSWVTFKCRSLSLIFLCNILLLLFFIFKDANKHSIVSCNAVKPLLRLMRSMDLRVKRNATGAILNLTHIRMYDKLPFIAVNLFTSRAVTFFDLPSLALIAKLNFFYIPEEENGCNSLEKLIIQRITSYLLFIRAWRSCMAVSRLITLAYIELKDVLELNFNKA